MYAIIEALVDLYGLCAHSLYDIWRLFRFFYNEIYIELCILATILIILTFEAWDDVGSQQQIARGNNSICEVIVQNCTDDIIGVFQFMGRFCAGAAQVMAIPVLVIITMYVVFATILLAPTGVLIVLGTLAEMCAA